MNDEFQGEPYPATPAYYWPILLLALALSLFLFKQVYALSQDTLRLRESQTNLSKQVEDQRKNLVPARNLQTFLQSLANEMIDLSATDSDVRKILEKHQIRREGGNPAPK